MTQTINQRVLICLTLAFICQLSLLIPGTKAQFLISHIRTRQDRAIQRLLKEILDLKLPITNKQEVESRRREESREFPVLQSQHQQSGIDEGDEQLKAISNCGSNSGKIGANCLSDSRLVDKPIQSRSFSLGSKSDTHQASTNGLSASGSKKSELRAMLANFERLIDQLSARKAKARS